MKVYKPIFGRLITMGRKERMLKLGLSKGSAFLLRKLGTIFYFVGKFKKLKGKGLLVRQRNKRCQDRLHCDVCVRNALK